MRDRLWIPNGPFTLAAVAALNACGGGDDDQKAQDPKGQGSLEMYAELTQSGIAAITQMQNGQLIIGYHPFYLTPTSVQVATLNTDRKSSTPYPPAGSGLLQSCRNPDGSFLPPVNGRYDFCIDWVLGSMRMRTASYGSSTQQSRPTGRSSAPEAGRAACQIRRLGHEVQHAFQGDRS
jgi:hypothetical protein